VTTTTELLPSVFRVTELALASVRRATEAVAALGTQRDGRQRVVEVTGEEAAAAFRSERVLRVGSSSPADLWDKLAGDYRGSDGWIRLHTNFAHHRSAALGVLGPGAGASREAVATRCAQWATSRLESAVVAAGGCAAVMRTVDEWAAHPHGRAVRDAELVDLESLGPAGRLALPDGDDGELAGLRVLDLCRVIAGPVAGRFLAAHGAKVTRIDGPELPDAEAVYLDGAFGKQRRLIDLRSAAGRSEFAELVRTSDAVIQAYRPGALAALGLAPRDLAAIRPGIVVVSLSAYGHHGPWATRRGFDSLVQLSTGLAAAGAAAVHSKQVAAGDVAPVALPCQALDHATGYLAAAGLLETIARQRAEGASWHVRVSLARTAAWLTDLGPVAGGLAIAEPGPALTAPFELTDDTVYGPITHVRCPGSIDGQRPFWRSGPPERREPTE
jgi:hypothetical protein